MSKQEFIEHFSAVIERMSDGYIIAHLKDGLKRYSEDRPSARREQELRKAAGLRREADLIEQYPQEF